MPRYGLVTARGSAVGAGRRRPRRRSRPGRRWPSSACAARTRARRCGPCRCRPRASGSPRRPRPRGNGPAGEQVVLVGGEHEPAAEHGEERLLPALDQVDDRGGLVRRVRAHAGLGVVAADAERHDGDGGQLGVRGRARRASVSSSTAPSLTPGHTTTWPWTSMPWSSSARSQRRLVAPRRLRSMRGPHSGSVAWIDTCSGDRPSVDDPLEVGLGEAGEGGEVPVEERQPVVVVLQVEAAAAGPSAAGR